LTVAVVVPLDTNVAVPLVIVSVADVNGVPVTTTVRVVPAQVVASAPHLDVDACAPGRVSCVRGGVSEQLCGDRPAVRIGQQGGARERVRDLPDRALVRGACSELSGLFSREDSSSHWMRPGFRRDGRGEVGAVRSVTGEVPGSCVSSTQWPNFGPAVNGKFRVRDDVRDREVVDAEPLLELRVGRDERIRQGGVGRARVRARDRWARRAQRRRAQRSRARGARGVGCPPAGSWTDGDSYSKDHRS